MVNVARAGLAVLIVLVLLFTFVQGDDAQARNPFNYFGYFTNLTSLMTAVLLFTTGARALRGRDASHGLVLARAAATACMIVVAVIYNLLVPGTGSAPAWVSAILHVIFPILLLLDWLLVPDHGRVRWSGIWVVLPYPLIWLAVVLVRGATDGWVPYGFLLPDQGALSLSMHVLGLAITLCLAGAVVWGTSGVARALQQQRLRPPR